MTYQGHAYSTAEDIRTAHRPPRDGRDPLGGLQDCRDAAICTPKMTVQKNGRDVDGMG